MSIVVVVVVVAAVATPALTLHLTIFAVTRCADPFPLSASLPVQNAFCRYTEALSAFGYFRYKTHFAVTRGPFPLTSGTKRIPRVADVTKP